MSNSYKPFNYYMKYSNNFLSKNLQDKWLIIENLFNKNITEPISKDKKIPKIIHQIWLGDNIPAEVLSLQATIQEANKDYDYKLWREADILNLDFKNKDLFKQAKNLGQKSDIARYAILKQFGGIYLDSDFKGIKSFDCLLHLSFFTGVSYDKEPTLFNGLIGTTNNNCIIEDLNNITEIRDQDGMDVIKSTGPWFMTKKVFKNINYLGNSEIVVLPVAFFYPYPNFSHDKIFGDLPDKYIFDETICIHLWHSRWN